MRVLKIDSRKPVQCDYCEDWACGEVPTIVGSGLYTRVCDVHRSLYEGLEGDPLAFRLIMATRDEERENRVLRATFERIRNDLDYALR